jgi:cytoskeletal protein CcmA (bactofilin family)
MNSGKQTIVEDGTELRGTLTSTCPIVVRGRVDGEVDTPSLLVSENGAVHGRAKVGALRSQGEISGEFDAETVELAGRVRDNTVIRARSLEVKLASEEGKYQVMFGECELAVGEAPTDETSAGKRSKTPAKGKRDGKTEPPAAEGESPAAIVGSSGLLPT